VNGVEISLARGTSASGVQQALDKLIDRELLAQRALAAGLERDPQVVESLDSARRQVLAQAYLERLARAARTPSRDETRAFYAQNPELFAERRIYRTRSLEVSAAPELLDAVRAEAARAASLDEVAGWLKARGARFSAVTEAQAAEDVLLAFLPALARMRAGEIALLGSSVVQLLRADDAALAEPEAAPRIEEFLAGRRRLEIAAAEIQRLRSSASIHYAAQFKR
jgi:EpsD family peptidyl-prolyl cis-trans isomerase